MSFVKQTFDASSPEEKIRKDSFRFLVSVVVFAWINLFFWFYVVSFPLLNTTWENVGPQEIPVSYRAGLVWFLVFFGLVNGLLPLILLFVVAQPNSLIRADLHLIFAFVSAALSLIAVVGIVVIYFVYCNSSLSAAAVACNSGDWCCVYSGTPGNEDQCPSAVPCIPPKTRDDLGGSNGEFNQLFWLYLAAFTVALFHWLINRVIRETGLARAYTDREARVFAAVFLLLCFGLLFWFVGFLVVNVNFLCGYPLLEGGSGIGDYVCTLYSWDYWFIWLLLLNVLPVVTFGVAMIVNTTAITPTLHQICAVAAAIATGAAFIYFCCILVFQTNDYLWSSPKSISNNERYCCDKFASHPDICPNTTPCLPGTSVRLIANPSPTFLQIFVASVVFLVHCTFHLVLNNRMKRYKVFYSAIEL